MTKPFRSISIRLVTLLIVSTIVPILFCSLIFYRTMRDYSMNRYLVQAESTMDVSVQNISHYVSTCVSASRGIYMNSNPTNAALKVLTYGNHSSVLLSQDTEPIFSYLFGIYASTPDAVQIRLLSYRMEKSFLIVSKDFQRSVMSVDLSEQGPVPEFVAFNQAYIEPTHPKNSYGHLIHYSTLEKKTPSESVFTIWIPIYNLPFAKDPIGVLAVDISNEFIEQNCRFAYDSDEAVYVLDENSTVIASTVFPESASSNLTLSYQPMPEDVTFTYEFQGDMLILRKNFSSELFSWQVIKTLPANTVYGDVNILLTTFMAVFSVGLITAAILNSLTVLRYTIPMRKAASYISGVDSKKKGGIDFQLSDYVAYPHNDEFSTLLNSFEDMLHSINKYKIRQYELEITNKNTELNMLQAQINPHFVYNTLQCLATNALKTNNYEQYDFISSFGQMLQYAMDMKHPVVTLREELNYVQRYVSLQKMRFKNEDSITLNIDPHVEDAALPKMTLQPLVENSISHGQVFNHPGSMLKCSAWQEGNFVIIEIVDNGIPISPKDCKRLQAAFQSYQQRFDSRSYTFQRLEELSIDSKTVQEDTERPHIGLENVYMRLLLNFGSESSMELFPNEFSGTTVRLRVPYRQL
ncbi:sensor histidine kinase [Youxingia wuxianensis]|uniref:Histidine kinase n=1 Tax=Youxingia wuxianensis TaxID=2763678 RepID=A0A926ICS6_9FIRM|nr:histidine kinase [Youxingia wuxianensis]MBC8585507.1 histidine kinase [Youxingia wuxianensis]